MRLDRSARIVVAALVTLAAVCFAAPWIAPYPPDAVDLTQLRAAPSAAHWLGTDELGRDVLSRLLFGGRASLALGVLAALLATAVGAGVGATAGYLGGGVDNLLMRLTDVALAIPTLPIAIVLGAYAGNSLPALIAAIAALSWMTTARVVRGEVLTLRETGFVAAAQGLGQSRYGTIRRHLLPNTAGVLAVSATIAVGNAILVESALSFLGLGVQPPTPTWGNMLTDAQATMATRPLLTVFPGLAILLVILGVNLCGEALRPRTRPI
ncbi:MAG: ABC transporter permease [Gemmatimonadetes bacterium]|nr:ABC transporter permease [Gemmatimonadota bacterium]